MSTVSAPECYRSPEALEIIHEAAAGNEAAEAFLYKVMEAMEIIDDMDSRDDIIKLMADMVSGWSGNAWAMQFHFAVQAIWVLSINAYLDSKHYCDPRMPRDAEIYGIRIATMAMEFIPFVAWTTGGYDHMRRISEKMRRTIGFKPHGDRPKHREVA